MIALLILAIVAGITLFASGIIWMFSDSITNDLAADIIGAVAIVTGLALAIWVIVYSGMEIAS